MLYTVAFNNMGVIFGQNVSFVSIGSMQQIPKSNPKEGGSFVSVGDHKSDQMYADDPLLNVAPSPNHHEPPDSAVA